ncbi:hypothetical protein ABW19_dt0208126 [Dactylella cylindrospora]|nr:hypothetical protein ABW19_dt0208126 [Dactylella cylindrospora]
MRWDNHADAKLFMAVLKVHSLKLNYEAIAEYMGDNCTSKAVSHRIAKLKNIGGEPASAPSSVVNTPKKSPTKRKRNMEDPVTIKKEQFERSLDSDADAEILIDAVATGSPKKRKRQLKPVPAPAPQMSFAPTEIDPDMSSIENFYSSSCASENSVYDDLDFAAFHQSYHEPSAGGMPGIPESDQAQFCINLPFS